MDLPPKLAIGSDDDLLIRVPDAEQRLVATVGEDIYQSEEKWRWERAVAQEIVRRWNAHAALMHACEMIRDADEDCRRDLLQRLPKAARDAIDAALELGGAPKAGW